MCQSNNITDKEIRLYFKSIKDRKIEEAEFNKMLEDEAMNQSNEINPYLRYQEPL